MKSSCDRKFENFYLLIMLIFFIIGSFFLKDVFAWEKLDYVTYYGNTGEEVTVAWENPCEKCADGNYCPSSGVCSDGSSCTPCTIPDEYEFKFFHKDMGQDLIIGTTSNTQVTVIIPKVGHYIVKVRSKKNDCVHEDPNDINSPMVPCYSDWAISTDPTYATVDNTHRAWWIFTWISPPGDIGIE